MLMLKCTGVAAFQQECLFCPAAASARIQRSHHQLSDSMMSLMHHAWHCNRREADLFSSAQGERLREWLQMQLQQSHIGNRLQSTSVTT